MKLRVGMHVVVTAGKDKGKTGVIVKAYPATEKVLISGVNQVVKHMKATQTHEGARYKKEMPIHVSNVAFLDPVHKKPSRIVFRTMEDGSKQRVSKLSGQPIEVIIPPRKSTSTT